MVDTTFMFLERLGFPDVILWLLSFAIVYGLLSQVSMPKSKEARAIISIVAAFFVLMAAPAQLVSVLSTMSTDLVLIILGLLVFIVFLEAAGVKVGKFRGKPGEEEGKVDITGMPIPLFTKHPKAFAIILIVIALMVFVGAGGLSLLGWQITFAAPGIMTIVFLIAILLAVMWLIGE